MTEEESRGLGQNIQFFLDQLNIPARTAEQRQALVAYSETMEVVEKIFNGQLIITEPVVEEAEGED